MEFHKKIVKIGGSMTLSIPIDLAKYYGLKKNTEVVLEDDGKNIIIRKK